LWPHPSTGPMPKVPVRFLERLIVIVENCIKLRIGEWNEPSFCAYDRDVFEEFIRPYSIATFKRQLNYYNFKVSLSRGGKIVFSHPNFTRKNYNKINRNTDITTKRPRRYKPILIPEVFEDDTTELKVEINSVSRCCSPISLVSDGIFADFEFGLDVLGHE